MSKYTPEQHAKLFWSKVAITADDNKCWLWTAGINNGYGRLSVNNKRYYAHCIAWAYPNYVTPDGMDICHSCDTPTCCNPKHLFIGTRQDNVNDMMAKGRYNEKRNRLHGEKHPSAILTNHQADEIRKRFSETKVTQAQLGREYNVHISTIHLIVRNKIRKISGAK